MVESLIQFLAILNPFALCLYLVTVMEDLNRRDFVGALTAACGASLVIFCLFAMVGETLLIKVLGVRPGALRIFGGVIFSIVAYNYVTKGYRAAVQFRGTLEELPSEIVVPFMIGAGTITQSILIGKRLPWHWTLVVIFLGVAISFGIIVQFTVLRERMHRGREKVFDRWVNIFARVNGLIIGAISAEMVISGIRGIWTAG